MNLDKFDKQEINVICDLCKSNGFQEFGDELSKYLNSNKQTMIDYIRSVDAKFDQLVQGNRKSLKIWERKMQDGAARILKEYND